MAQHVSGQTPGGLFDDIRKGDLIEMMDPQVRFSPAAHIQRRFCLNVLAAQMHVSLHGAAVAGLQIAVPKKVDQFVRHVLRADSKPGQVEKGHKLFFVQKADGITEILLYKMTDGFGGKLFLIQIGDLQDQAEGRCGLQSIQERRADG